MIKAERNADLLFLLSLLPNLERLDERKKLEVKIKMQQILFEAEFE